MPDIFDQVAAEQSAASPATKQAGDVFDQVATGGQQPAKGPAIEALPTAGGISDRDLAQSLSGGDPAQYGIARLTIPGIKALLKVHEAIKSAENLTQEGREVHPIQAKLGDMAAAIEGLLVGQTNRRDEAIGTGEYGVLNNPATAAVIATPGTESLLSNAEEAVKGARLGKAREPGIIQQIKEGKAVEQVPAKAAIRTAAGAEGEAPILEGNQTVLDKKIGDLASQKQAAYKQIDNAVGFDLKAAKQELSDNQYALKQPGANAEKIQDKITDLQGRISSAESTLKERGIDPKGADKINQQWMAGKQIKKALVTSTDSEGNVNVSGFLNRVKNLRFDKMGDRPAQFFGKDGADKLVSALQEAHAQGVAAVSKQQAVKWIARIIGVGAAYDVFRHVTE